MQAWNKTRSISVTQTIPESLNTRIINNITQLNKTPAQTYLSITQDSFSPFVRWQPN